MFVRLSLLLTAAFVVLFQQMVVNNWWVVVNMYTSLHAEKYKKLIRLYFVVFWILVVLLLMNIMIAIVLEIYGTLQPEIES